MPPARGCLHKAIAGVVDISLPTVNSFIGRIYEKLHVHSRARAAVQYAKLPGRKG